MVTRVRDIFREIFKDSAQSFSVARRVCFEKNAKLNGTPVNFWGEVKIKEGDRFDVGKGGLRHWIFENGQWIRKVNDDS